MPLNLLPIWSSYAIISLLVYTASKDPWPSLFHNLKITSFFLFLFLYFLIRTLLEHQKSQMDTRSYFGEASSGRGSRSGSSRRGKKSSSSKEKPKQPQRGLGVAQLEKIRLRSETGCYYVPSFHDPSSINLQVFEVCGF